MWSSHDTKSTLSSAVKNISHCGNCSKIILRRHCLNFLTDARLVCEPHGWRTTCCKIQCHSSLLWPKVSTRVSNVRWEGTKIRWSTVSKAVDRSRRSDIACWPQSAAQRRSFKTLTSAVSALWPALKADWNFSETTFSKTFARNGSFEIGQKSSNMSGSSVGFLWGCTIAILK